MSVHGLLFIVKVGTAIGLLVGAGTACAATAEAYRRIDAQGIELIRNRIPASAPSDVASAASRPARAAAAMSAAGPASAILAREARSTVSAREQSLRDRDRLAILHQELSAETAHYQRMQQTLDHPALKSRPDGEEWRRLREQCDRHEQNIKALHAEIRRASASGDR